MKTSELVFNYLREQGYRPRTDERGNITFEYQNGTFIYCNNDEDKLFFQLALPGIMQVNEGNYYIALEAINQLNNDRKVIKGMILNNTSVWLMAEILLDRTPDVGDLIPRLLNMLMGGWNYFNEKVR